MSSDNDLHFCWEQVLKTNRLFRISHLFSPAEFSGQLLALHALFASIEQLGSEVSEELVARRKLDWWRFELLSGDITKSTHPVLRYLNRTGAAGSLPGPALEMLLDRAEARLDARAPSNRDEFSQLCGALYMPKLILECALSGQGESLLSGHRSTARTGGLIQLLRESCRKTDRAFWWVPMDVLARFGVSRHDLVENGDAQAVRAVFQEVLGDIPRLSSPAVARTTGKPAITKGLVHIQLLATLQSRQVARLLKQKPSSYGDELDRWYISDVITAWREARYLRMNAASL
jgi:phytoene synthase